MLFDTSIPVAVEAAKSLDDLRSARIRADYQLNAAGFHSRQIAQDWVEDALQVKRYIEQCRLEPTRSEIARAINSSGDDAT